MKKLFIFVSVMIVGVLVVWKLASRNRSETATETKPEVELRQDSRATLLALRPREGQAAPAPNVGAHNVTSARRRSWWEMKAAGEQVRREFKEEGKYANIFAKEAQWQEKFKRLRKDMTVQEAVAVMGEPPTFLLAVTNSDGTPVMVPVPTNALQNLTFSVFGLG